VLLDKRISSLLNHLIAEPSRDVSPEILGLTPRSTLCLTLLLLDLLLPTRSSPGSATGNPLALANRIRMSVKLTTPTRCPLILAPGRALAETEGPVGETNSVEFTGAGWDEPKLLGDGAVTWD
jgi:hypothetical protein